MGNQYDPWREDYRLVRNANRSAGRVVGAAACLLVVAALVVALMFLIGCASDSPGQAGAFSKQDLTTLRDMIDSHDQTATQESGRDSVSIQSGDTGTLGWIAIIVAFLSYPTMRTGRRILWRLQNGR